MAGWIALLVVLAVLGGLAICFFWGVSFRG
jgi:hypothetical protein